MIYFITDGRYTKIGVAEDPQKRLKELQTGNPLELSVAKTINGSFDEEGKLHSMLHLYKIRGEWYDWNNFDDEVIELILTDKTKSTLKPTYLSESTFKNVYYSILSDNGYVLAEEFSDKIGYSVQTVKRRVNKYNLKLHNKKYITTQRKIIVGGEEIHFKDKEVITKSRVSRRASVSRPTVNNHWNDVYDYFEELNNNLKK